MDNFHLARRQTQVLQKVLASDQNRNETGRNWVLRNRLAVSFRHDFIPRHSAEHFGRKRATPTRRKRVGRLPRG